MTDAFLNVNDNVQNLRNNTCAEGSNSEYELFKKSVYHTCIIPCFWAWEAVHNRAFSKSFGIRYFMYVYYV